MRTAASLYTRVESTLFLDGSSRQYVLRIHDLPPEEKPREKLLAHGPEILSASELLAVVLTTGTKKEDVLSMARRVLKEYGDSSIISVRNPKTLAADLAIPLGKAVQIVAVGEIGRRFFKRNEAAHAPTIRTAKDVFEHVRDTRGLAKEYLRGLYLNTHYKIIHDEIVSIGTVDSNMVHPREVFRPALEYAAAAVILVHNHPSGIAEPSETDLLVTKQLIEAGKILGIDVIDHLIVTNDAFTSIPACYPA